MVDKEFIEKIKESINENLDEAEKELNIQKENLTYGFSSGYWEGRKHAFEYALNLINII